MLLEKQGLNDDDFRRLENDPCQTILEEHEDAMLAFVVKALKNPGAVTDADILKLRELGWTDKDMVDAMLHGVSMTNHAVMMQVFDMDSNCLL
jgi:alkylhydroperoxidase family enzyme